MNIEKLIHWLEQRNIHVLEDRLYADGTRVVTFTASLPECETSGRHVWYPIVIPKGKFDVSKSEIESLLGRLWHGELELPEELLDC